MEGRLAEEDLGEAGLDGVGGAEVAEGEFHQLKTLLIELDVVLADCKFQPYSMSGKVFRRSEGWRVST